MRYFVKCFLLITLVFTSNLSSQPKIIWEKYFEPDSLSSMWLYNFEKINNQLYLGYFARSPNWKTVTDPENTGLLITDLNGNLNQRFEMIIDKTIFLRDIKKEKNKIIFFGFEGDIQYPTIIKTDSIGKIERLTIDTSISTFYIYQNSKFHSPYYKDDSLLLFTKHIDSTEFYYIIYNNDLEVSSKVKMDLSNINFSILATPALYSVYKSNDNSIYATYPGPEDSTMNNYDYLTMVKFNLEGKLVWDKKLEYENYKKIKPEKFIDNSEGDFIVFGNLTNDNRDTNFIGKMTHDGYWEWIKLFKSYQRDNYTELFASKYYCIYGRNYSKDIKQNQYWFKIFDNSGNTITEYSWHNNAFNSIQGITEKENGNLIIYGRHGFDSVYLAEIEVPVLSYKDSKEYDNTNLSCAPNPTDNNINIRYSIEKVGIINIFLTDILGNQTLLKSENKFPGDYVETFNLNVYPQGIYNIVLQSDNTIYNDRIILIR